MATESIFRPFYLKDDAAVDRFLELQEMPPKKVKQTGAYEEGVETLRRLAAQYYEQANSSPED